MHSATALEAPELASPGPAGAGEESPWAMLARDILGAAERPEAGRLASAEGLAFLLAAVDDTGEIRARWRHRRGGWQRDARSATSAAQRLRNPLSSSWLPTFTAA